MLKLSEDQRTTEVIDLWSEDTKQDAWFTQSALDIGFKWLEYMYPGFSVYLFSGNLIPYLFCNIIFYIKMVSRITAYIILVLSKAYNFCFIDQ